MQFLDFEQPIIELEAKIRDLSLLDDKNKEIFSLKKDINSFLEKTYEKLTPWQITQVARHPNRPHASHYINAFIKDFQVLSGDRSYSEDKAIISGIGYFNDESVLVIGQEKGSDTESRLKHNFGMARPEGYRKANRLMKLANKFNIPIITFVDTAGAYPGVGAEERGQAEAIASCIQTSLEIRVPIISIIIGEGGSGGAIALASANKVLMLQNAIYSVISPEGCASILWRDNSKAELAADSLGITAKILKENNIIEEIINEPIGGAHRDHSLSIKNVEESIKKALNEIKAYSKDKLLLDRKEKFIQYGRFFK
ncbi:MAG: acetyl-CoA carboxylase carboxyltransferase subunit alpha [Alphaproteobacteria bacterium]|jgi:acetyl-CoA carboxylase carboxyl transferase subunit alpha|nr:acetyl-CoA carboxylase carboxyltransferase subunit alpha [Alphaproteobacteria bacterium]|tara:strand:- start:33 stop:968 length:936 start_codon:yes stop_codon:yes gene_type:complete